MTTLYEMNQNEANFLKEKFPGMGSLFDKSKLHDPVKSLEVIKRFSSLWPLRDKYLLFLIFFFYFS